MEALELELNWLKEEKQRLADRYIAERSDDKSKIIMTKLIDIMSMAGSVQYRLNIMKAGL